jgi:toxin YoeB
MRKISFLPQAFADFTVWTTEDKKVYAKLVELIKEVNRSPFTGIGKPEPL